jgi:hypothetical protein
MNTLVRPVAPASKGLACSREDGVRHLCGRADRMVGDDVARAREALVQLELDFHAIGVGPLDELAVAEVLAQLAVDGELAACPLDDRCIEDDVGLVDLQLARTHGRTDVVDGTERTGCRCPARAPDAPRGRVVIATRL